MNIPKVQNMSPALTKSLERFSVELGIGGSQRYNWLFLFLGYWQFPLRSPYNLFLIIEISDIGKPSLFFTLSSRVQKFWVFAYFTISKYKLAYAKCLYHTRNNHVQSLQYLQEGLTNWNLGHIILYDIER